MSRRNWRRVQPSSLQESIRCCIDCARETRNLSVQQIADLLGVSEWTVYGWLKDGSLPARKILGFEHATGADFVSRYLAHAGHHLVIPIPVGRKVDPADINRLNAHLTDAVSCLIAFYDSPTEDAAKKTLGAVTTALEDLGYHHNNITKHQQPELGFEDES